MWSPSRRHVRISQEWWEESNSKIFRETNILPPSFLLSSPQANDKSVVKLKVPVKHTGGVNSYWVRTQAFLPSHHSGQDQSASSSHGSHRAGFLCVALLSVPTQANLLMCVSTIPPPRECEMGTMTRLLSGPRAKWWQPIQPQHFLRHSVAGAKHGASREMGVKVYRCRQMRRPKSSVRGMCLSQKEWDWQPKQSAEPRDREKGVNIFSSQDLAVPNEREGCLRRRHLPGWPE